MVERPEMKMWKIAAAAAFFGVCVVCALVAATPRSASPYHKLSLFAQVLSTIERGYVKPIDGEEIIVGAVKGMVRTLDPHSTYLTPAEHRALLADLRGEFEGVGLEVGFKDDIMTVIAPIVDSPAEKAGLQPGDQIFKIEGKPTKNMSLDDAVLLMRGKIGTEVTVTIRRPDEKEPFDVTLVRDVIHITSVVADLIAPGFPHIRVRGFQDGTSSEVKDAVSRLSVEGGGLDGVLLDLRRNPGGTVEEAIRVCDLFISSGIILSTRGRGEIIISEDRAHKRGTIADVPMVVLIDGGSASAAEIVAGAIQDHGRGLIVGTRSFGKGSVQSIYPLADGSGLKLTVALYFTPQGRAIQALGVTPDVVVGSRNAPEPDEETLLLQKMPEERELPGHLDNGDEEPLREDEPEIDDYQLKTAFQLLRGLSRLRKAGAARRKPSS